MAKSVKCGFDSQPGGAKGQQLLVAYGPTLLVNIGFDPSYKPGQQGPPVAGIEGLRALVDTGATESCIDSTLATTLALPVVDRRRVCGSSGEHEVNVYLAQVHVPSLQYTIYGAFAGVHLQAGGQPHVALLGRTFLRSLTMT